MHAPARSEPHAPYPLPASVPSRDPLPFQKPAEADSSCRSATRPVFFGVKPGTFFLTTCITPTCTGVSCGGNSALAAGICTRLSLTGTGAWLGAARNFVQSKFTDANCAYGQSHVHMCTVVLQGMFYTKILRKQKEKLMY